MKRICIFGVAFFLLCLMCNPVAAGSGWWDEDYGQRIDLTIPASSISGDLQQFPVMIHLGDASGTNGQDTRAVFTEIGADYTKLVIVTEDGETLPVEVTEWNATAQEAWLYTPVNLSSSSDTEIYLYYDSAASANTQIGATGTAPAQQVWTNGYAGVWMKPSGGLLLDSTRNQNHGTIYGATVTQGPLGACLSFDGVDDYAEIADDDVLDFDDSGALTATVVCHTRSSPAANWADILSKGDYENYGISIQSNDAIRNVVDTTIGGSTRFLLVDAVGNDHVLSITAVSGGAFVSYDNGAAIDQVDLLVGALQNTTHPLRFGFDKGGNYYDGTIFFAAISSVARSPAWIAATNAALRDELIVYSAAGTPVTAADFSADATAITLGETVAFTATTTGADAWSWDFGDGSTSSVQNPTHTYTSGGTYTVTLTASNGFDYLEITKTNYITVLEANFSGSPLTGPSPLTVNFTDESINADAWSWDFGDGNTSFVQNPIHTYTAAGTYTVTLTASNASVEDSMERVDYITVDPPVSAQFSATPTRGTTPLTVQFTDLSVGEPTSWLWTFGDGSTSSVQNPSHTYTAAGFYTVTLNVSNAYGDDSTEKADYIDIGVPVVAAWAANATETKGFPATIAFTDHSTGEPTSWLWTFGDGSTSSVQNPTHTYMIDGTYQVTLTATNAYGNDTYSGYIAIGHAGYRPKATGIMAPIDISAWESLYGAFGGEEVVAADETGEPDWLTITTVSLAPFLSTWGLLFWVIFYAVPFIVPWIRQEAVIIPSILGLIIGAAMLAKLPGEYHLPAQIFLALSITGIILVAVTFKRSGY